MLTLDDLPTLKGRRIWEAPDPPVKSLNTHRPYRPHPLKERREEEEVSWLLSTQTCPGVPENLEFISGCSSEP